jgi:(2Fe-2S) ferredoxin
MSDPLPTHRKVGDPPLFFEAHLFVCCNRRPDGHKRLRDYMKARAKELGLGRVRVNMAGCLDRCELGPCMVIYPEGIWYRINNEFDVDAVLQAHLRDGGRVDHLMLPAE